MQLSPDNLAFVVPTHNMPEATLCAVESALANTRDLKTVIVGMHHHFSPGWDYRDIETSSVKES